MRFFFINAEIQRDETPQPYNINNYNGDSDADDLAALKDKLINDYGYDPGGYENNPYLLEGEKFLVRLDYNLSNIHKLTFRHSYVNNVATDPYNSSNSSVRFYLGEYFPSVTNGTTVELKSNFSNSSNDLIIGYTTVRDDRDPLGDPFPSVQIYDGSGTIYFGAEPYSTANELNQNILTITDNYSIYKGKHTITILPLRTPCVLLNCYTLIQTLKFLLMMSGTIFIKSYGNCR